MGDTVVPAVQKAVTSDGPGSVRVAKNWSVQDLQPDQVLIKTVAVALNPADWKYVDFAQTPWPVCGCDAAGVVIKVGKDVKKPIRVGERVACVAMGAFAEYVATVGDLCIRIPSTMPFENAASLGVGLLTVGLAFWSLGLVTINIANFPVEESENAHFLVYGASTATGTLAIQLLRGLGYLPIAVCSPRNFGLAKKAGAAACLDYRSPSCLEDIRQLTAGRLKYALDCISTSKSTTLCYGCLGSEGGKYTALAPFPDRLRLRKKSVKPDWVLTWTAFGIEDGVYEKESTVAEREFARDWVDKMETLLSRELLQPHPIQVQSGCLEGIESGLDELRKGLVSGKKLVYVVT